MMRLMTKATDKNTKIESEPSIVCWIALGFGLGWAFCLWTIILLK